MPDSDIEEFSNDREEIHAAFLRGTTSEEIANQFEVTPEDVDDFIDNLPPDMKG